MKRPAVFFDRDNTLIASDGYLGDASAVKLVDHAADAVARVRALGYATVVFSNQSGVARGMFGEDAVHAVNARLDELLLDHNPTAVIDRHEFCPFHPDAVIEKYRQDSELRKPKPGMIKQAADKLALELSRSWVLGDAPRDIEAGRAAGCLTILISDPNLIASPAAHQLSNVEPDYKAHSLSEAIEIIAKHRAVEMADNERQQTVTQTMEPATRTDSEEDFSAETDAVQSPETNDPNAIKLSKLQVTAEQILHELRRRNEHQHVDFSVSKLLAGIVQIISLATIFYGYLSRGSPGFTSILLVGIFLQTLTIALLIMSKDR